MKKLKKILLLCIIVYGILFFNPVKTFAWGGEEVEINKGNGDIEFKSTDKVATSGNYWNTVGFIIRLDTCSGNPLKDSKYIKVLFSEKEIVKEEKIYTTDGIKYKTTTFTIPGSIMDEKYEKSRYKEFNNVKNGDKIYVNHIFQVNSTGKYYYTYNTISVAKPWDPSGFKSKFDRPGIYASSEKKYPIKIEFQETTKNKKTVNHTVNYDEQRSHTDFHIDGTVIPQSLTSKVTNKTYKLYRVHYEKTGSSKIYDKRITYVNAKTNPAEYTASLDYIRKRDISVPTGGLKIVAVYKYMEATEDKEEEIIVNQEDAYPRAVIKADNRGQEKFDVEDGIPTTEKLYTNVFSPEYQTDYSYKNIKGEKTYLITVKKTYNLSWTTYQPGPSGPDGKPGPPIPIPHSDSQTISQKYSVKRQYSYWYIPYLNYYEVDKAILRNDSFSEKSVTLIPNSYNPPKLTYTKPKSYIVDPKINEIILPSVSLSKDGSKPSIPSEDWSNQAEDGCGKIKCYNDNLTFNGTIYMDGSMKEEKTTTPKKLPECLKDIGEDVLYKKGLTIPGKLKNDEYTSDGYVVYKRTFNIGGKGESECRYDIEDINNVFVHTPTVCDGKIESNKSDNQMISPDQGKASLVLDRNFTVSLPTTGEHLYIKGYQYNDYGKYIASRKVQFPFDVYLGNTYIPKYSWITLSSDFTEFNLPIWVDEGQYTVKFKSEAINKQTDSLEELANLNPLNYIAEDSVEVEISGRIYGLNIYDISDYPTWQEVFRKPNSLKLSGFQYTVGTKDKNGISTGKNPKYTLPLINGSHPKLKNT